MCFGAQEVRSTLYAKNCVETRYIDVEIGALDCRYFLVVCRFATKKVSSNPSDCPEFPPFGEGPTSSSRKFG